MLSQKCVCDGKLAHIPLNGLHMRNLFAMCAHTPFSELVCPPYLKCRGGTPALSHMQGRHPIFVHMWDEPRPLTKRQGLTSAIGRSNGYEGNTTNNTFANLQDTHMLAPFAGVCKT